MVATNSVACKTGNVSSGTSANLTVVLEKPLRNYYKEIDVVATPDGKGAVIIHANNCTTEINEWVNTFMQVVELLGHKVDKGELFTKLFNHSLKSDMDVGGIVSYNFLAGEPIAGTQIGAPMVARRQDGEMNLANFMQSQIYSAVASLALGVNILEKEGVKIDSVLAHGGFYKTDLVGQNATSAVLKTPITVMKTASEGGAWGVALLALYVLNNKIPFTKFLDGIFKNVDKTVVMASEKEIEKCNRFMTRYKKALKGEKLISETL